MKILHVVWCHNWLFSKGDTRLYCAWGLIIKLNSKENSIWFEPRSKRRSYSEILSVSEVIFRVIFLTLKTTSAQVGERPVTTTDNSSCQDFTSPDDLTIRSTVKRMPQNLNLNKDNLLLTYSWSWCCWWYCCCRFLNINYKNV